MAEYIIPLRRGFVKVPRHERSKRAVKVLRTFLNRHIKADEIKIGQHLNEHIWNNGIRNPPGKVAVVSTIVEKDGVKIAQVELQGKKFSESVRPEERVEQEGGLKGKLQAMTQAKEEPKEQKTEEQKTETAKPADTSAKKPPATETPKKAPTTASKPTKTE